jgi:sarcosine oxidase / L-pipecolate oxidase
MIDPNTSVLIVGAGTFGLSTAVQLLRKGHKNVTLLDPYEVPSPLSAGNDVNKVFQSTVESEFYSELALEALEMWRTDPLYKPAFHEVGIIYGACGDAIVPELEKRLKLLEKNNADFVKLDTPEDYAKYVKSPNCTIEDELKAVNLDGRFKNWKGYYQKTMCGWTYAALALQNAANECKKNGAKFLVGAAQGVNFDEDGTCNGVTTEDGEIIKADITVICAGANSGKLLDFGGQLLAKCWTVGHIQLTEKEAKSLKELPVILNLDQGFVFEPDVNNELKFCNEFPGYINMIEEKKTSIPVYRNKIPVEAEKQMRGFLRQVFPSFAERPFSATTICWCTDTPDRHFLFSEHPDHKGLVLGTGDSGQGFKYMPNVGKYISQIILEGNKSLPEEKLKAWSWRKEQAGDRDIGALQGRFGGSNILKDLKDIEEWTEAK